MIELTDRCGYCGHERQQHIYHEGKCRPGFVCNALCERFVEPNAGKKVTRVRAEREPMVVIPRSEYMRLKALEP